MSNTKISISIIPEKNENLSIDDLYEGIPYIRIQPMSNIIISFLKIKPIIDETKGRVIEDYVRYDNIYFSTDKEKWYKNGFETHQTISKKIIIYIKFDVLRELGYLPDMEMYYILGSHVTRGNKRWEC